MEQTELGPGPRVTGTGLVDQWKRVNGMKMEGEQEDRQQKGGPDQALSMENPRLHCRQHDSPINRQRQLWLSIDTDAYGSCHDNQLQRPLRKGLTQTFHFFATFSLNSRGNALTAGKRSIHW